jgi:hypothetical protein
MSHTQFSQAFLYETERHAAWGGAQLEALMGFLPEGASWTADLPTCRYRQGHVDIRVGVLGTYDAAQRSWMWGWANPELRGTPVAALSEQVGRFGQSQGIAEFTTQVLDLSGFPDPRRAAETLAFAGMGVTGAPGYIGVPANPETQVYFLPEDPQVPRAPLDPVTLPRTLVQAEGLLGVDAKRLVAGFFDHHGVAYRDNGGQIAAELPGSVPAEIGFDEAGRIAGIRLALH